MKNENLAVTRTEITGAKIVLDKLSEHGVKYVFAVPGRESEGILFNESPVIEQTTSPSNKSSYHEVKYVKHEDLYYIQHPALFNDIANRTGIIIKIEGKKQSFIPKNIMEEKLDSSILSRFRNKYSEIERYFFILEML